MSQGNLLQSYNWEAQYDDNQTQFPRPVSDEVISIYEVYVKEENAGHDGRNDVSVMPGLPSDNDHQLIQGDCMDLDAAIEADANAEGAITKFLGKDALKYKILDQNVGTIDENVVVYSRPPVENSPSTTTRLIDKDDPRSRLHFIKYLKRDGKTLKIWECGICSKEFRHQYTLMRHLPTHTDERNFKCEACGKAFRQLSTLSQHKAIHSDARPYVCEFCKKTFNRVSTLISHRKTHSEHKPHKCHLCGKGFHQKGNLRNHVFTHTNERPYKCELCGKGFNQMSNLVCHKVKAHAHAQTDKLQYVCGICGKEFPRRFSLRSHEEFKHGIKYRHPGSIQLEVNDKNVIRNKNVRIVQLPSGDQNKITEVPNKDLVTTTEYLDNVIIDSIETKAMEMAIAQGQTPFALFKPIKGIPVLVKVLPAGPHKNMLTPATAEDLRMTGKMSMNPSITADVDGSKAVQVKVPIVATVIQKLESDGKLHFVIEPPGPENEQGLLSNYHHPESLVTPLDSHFPYPEHVRPEPPRQNATSSLDECNELLELAAQGGIQFVRATEDGHYEIMTNSEARDLMAQNSHDVTILDGEEADAINVLNIRGNGEVIIGDSDNQIMVLDSAPPQKSMSMDGIEILEDKDIKILESKNLEDRFVDGITFLSQSKLDDLILGPKPLEMDSIVHDDESMVNPQQDLTNLIGHRNDPSSLSALENPQTTLPPLLTKNHTPMSLLNDTLSYGKSNQCLVEDLGILNDSIIENHHPEFDGKIKLSSVFDDSIGEPNLMPLTSNSEVKFLNAGHPSANVPSKVFPGVGEVKILGPKTHTQEFITSQYPELKMLSPYEQFLKNSAQQMNNCNFVPISSISERKEVKILGKKLGTGIITNVEDGSTVKILDEKDRSDTISGFCNNTENLSSPRLEKQGPINGATDSFMIQGYSPCATDLLSFENSHVPKDNPLSSHFESNQKECRDRFPTVDLPDLD